MTFPERIFAWIEDVSGADEPFYASGTWATREPEEPRYDGEAEYARFRWIPVDEIPCEIGRYVPARYCRKEDETGHSEYVGMAVLTPDGWWPEGPRVDDDEWVVTHYCDLPPLPKPENG